jgi:predicted small secreted protein
MPLKMLSHIAFVLSFLMLASCGANGTAQGGGNDSSSYGHVRVGIPF